MLYTHIGYGSLMKRVLTNNEVNMNFIQLHDRVMVKRESEEDVTKGELLSLIQLRKSQCSSYCWFCQKLKMELLF